MTKSAMAVVELSMVKALLSKAVHQKCPTISVLDNGDGHSQGLGQCDVHGSGTARWRDDSWIWGGSVAVASSSSWCSWCLREEAVAVRV
ncbi:hypothetical protein TIFTF001_020189 [Ficus carica]|uniref:Uncharacterized protein n=1 Tax=Ficus carica TaxID=3494 RepID=A0AA88A839_FICCA|nr:hypothetical protein TIFTF001_020189 [Ficus carica]